MKHLFSIMLVAVFLISCNKNELVELPNDADQLEQLLKSAQIDGENERSAELVYPVEYTMPDGTIISINTKEETRTIFQEWYGSNPGYTERPVLVYPVQMTFKGKTYTINNDREMKRILAASKKNTDEGETERFSIEQKQAMAQHLLNKGIESEKVRQTLRAAILALGETKGLGRDYQMSDRLINYLTNVVGLSNEQIEVVRLLMIRMSNI